MDTNIYLPVAELIEHDQFFFHIWISSYQAC